MPILQEFTQFPNESALISRIMAGYAILELDLMHCVQNALNQDLDTALKSMFSLRGEKRRIEEADTGSEDQPSYTLIGDTVNVASRLEELNKDRGTEVIFSAATKERMKIDIRVRKLEVAKLKGISQPIEIFTLD